MPKDNNPSISLLSKFKSANKRVLISPLGLLVLAACGGGGGSGGGVSTPAPRDGFGIKGPLLDAFAFLDYDGDGAWDEATEPFDRTEAGGKFEFAGSNDPNFATANVVILTDEQTVDESSGNSISGITLTAPAAAEVVSLASTLMVEANLDEAEVKEALGLSDVANILEFNPYSETLSAEEKEVAAKVEVASQQIAAVVQTMAAASEGAGLTQAEAMATSIAAVAKVVETKVLAAKAPGGSGVIEAYAPSTTPALPARSLRIGQSGRWSPWQDLTRCESVSRMD